MGEQWKRGTWGWSDREEKQTKVVLKGANGIWERKSKEFLISSSFFCHFSLSPSHFYVSAAFLFHSLFKLHALHLITHAYLTLLHLQKQWTYSLAFRVLMKAPRVVAPSLFPYTSSQLNSSNPTLPAAHYTIHSTSTPKTWPNILSLSVLFLFLCRNSITEGLCYKA